jgi:hypothetical protein
LENFEEENDVEEMEVTRKSVFFSQLNMVAIGSYLLQHLLIATM